MLSRTSLPWRVGLLLWVVPGLVRAQAADPRVGLFEGQDDVGTVLQKGATQYDPATQTYSISGSGENMWFAKDDFHFVWKKVSGDMTLTAKIAFPAKEGNAHKKAVLMVRQSLATDAAYVDVAVHGDGLTSLQAREESGAATHEVGINAAHPARVRIAKRGDYFYMWLAGEDQKLRFAGGSMRVRLTAPFYVGIGVCAHDKNAMEKAMFSSVELVNGLRNPGGEPVLHSTLETISVASTDRRVVQVEAQRLESPVWTLDGASLQYRSNGTAYRIPARGNGTPERVPAGPALSAAEDSRDTYISSDRGGTTQIWRQPRDGTDAQPVTSDEFTNCFPQVSPDGKQVAFLSYEKGTVGCPADKDVMLRVVSVQDKTLRLLAKFMGGKGTLDGSPWAPDGRSLALVSYQLVPQ